ncbi:MAG: hypothetical protein COA32_03055 [Fluviicola sp.]|nr:MAG: hypothetical protein COA32_03055 [Fluviicola sp.]
MACLICKGQSDSTIIAKKEYKAYTNEFMISAGYEYCTRNFMDVGLRYYHWRNDGQTAMAFSGFAIGTEISLVEKEQIYIPYIGWQGQYMFIAYGLRAEYGIGKKNQAFSILPEIGLSLIELLRITAGYRFVVENKDPLNLSGFRFSVIVAFPLSFLKKDV